MPATPFEDAVLHGGANDASEIGSCNRACRADAKSVSTPRGGEGRKIESLSQAAGDETEQPLVPSLAARPKEWAPTCFLVRQRDRFFQQPRFDRPPLYVHRFELLGDGARGDIVVGGEEFGSERGGAHPSPGIDARSEHEAEAIAIRRPLEPRHICQS